MGNQKQTGDPRDKFPIYARSILEALPDAVLLLNKDLKVLLANSLFLSSFELREEDVGECSLSDIAGGEFNIPELFRQIEEIINAGKLPGKAPSEYILNKTKKRVYLKVSLVPDDEDTVDAVCREKGPFILILANGGISRTPEEDMFSVKARFFKLVLDSLPIGIAVNNIQPAVKFKYMNDNFWKFYHVSRESLKGPGSFWDSVYRDPEFREKIKKRVIDDVAKGDPEKMRWVDVPVTLEDGEVFYVTAQNIPVPGEDIMVSTVMDVTRRVESEKKTEQALDSLRIERDRLLAIVSGIDEEVWFADTNKKFVLANPSARYGFTLGEEVEVDIETLAESLEVYRQDMTPRPVEETPALRALKGEEVFQEQEIVKLPATGELRRRLVSAKPIKDPSGNIIGAVSLVRDITKEQGKSAD